MCNSYQGYTNYPTWAVSLWLGNDEGSYSQWDDRAQELANKHGKEDAVYKLAEELKDEVMEGDPLSGSMYSDMLSWATGLVNWNDIAENMLEDIEPEGDEEDSEDDD